MTLRSRLIGFSMLAIGFISVALLLVGEHIFSREIDQLSTEVYQARLDKFLKLAKEQDDLYFEGVYTSEQEPRERVIDHFRVFYRDHPDSEVFPFIIDGQGSVLAHPTLSRGDVWIDKALLQQMNRGQGDFEDQGRKYWAAFACFEPWDWKFVYSVPYSIKIQALETARQRQIWTVVICMAIFVVIFYLLIRLRPWN